MSNYTQLNDYFNVSANAFESGKFTSSSKGPSSGPDPDPDLGGLYTISSFSGEASGTVFEQF